MAETVAAILAAHRSGKTRPEDTIARSFARLKDRGDPAIFISVREETAALAEARALAQAGNSELPLYGIPVAVKDNIDVAGLPTTAACPAYSYSPHADAAAVARLRAAGAIVIGKTNLDQFATGLVGVRSPYGVPRNPFNPALIPGGSSSGSAVAVATGIVPLALGTDTAGSGRVPAGLNNIVGLKPSLGLVPTGGVVPACRSLDCVSVFALTSDDAFAALQAMAGFDAADPYSRRIATGALGPFSPHLRIAVPAASELHFFGDRHAEQAFSAAVDLLRMLGADVVETDISPLLQTARLLYEGPWVAERYAAVGDFIERNPDKVHPVTRAIVSGGRELRAVDGFKAFYRLAEFRRKAEDIFAQTDALMVPTAPAAYTVKELAANPIELNSNLGTYTNFVNLLDLCGLAVPAAVSPAGTPYGVTFLAPAGQDAALASLGRGFHARTGLALGALDAAQPALAPVAPAPGKDEIAVAVVGAHLSGMPLNGELRALGARFLETARTAADYRLFALAGTHPPKPGLLRVAPGRGAAIELEIWALPAGHFGRFVAAIPAPLCIGTLSIAGGRSVQGFLVEAEAVHDARDISEFGGWRAYVAAQKVPA